MTKIKTGQNTDTDTLRDKIVWALQEKKAAEVIELDLRHLGIALFDKFVICTATSNVHAQSLCENLLYSVKKDLRILPKNVEGVANSQWILVDYFDIVVHIFLQQTRTFYDIEGLWKDANLTKYE